MTYADEEAWARHYEKHHGMSEAEFFLYNEGTPVVEEEEFEEYEDDF